MTIAGSKYVGPCPCGRTDLARREPPLCYSCNQRERRVWKSKECAAPGCEIMTKKGHETCYRCRRKKWTFCDICGALTRHRRGGNSKADKFCETCAGPVPVPRFVYAYRIPVSKMVEMINEQSGQCAIPSCNNTSLGVDHDHDCCPTPARSCGKCVRALLCDSCNSLLGRLEKSAPRIEELLSYRAFWKAVHYG